MLEQFLFEVKTIWQTFWFRISGTFSFATTSINKPLQHSKQNCFKTFHFNKKLIKWLLTKWSSFEPCDGPIFRWPFSGPDDLPASLEVEGSSDAAVLADAVLGDDVGIVLGSWKTCKSLLFCFHLFWSCFSFELSLSVVLMNFVDFYYGDICH